jgi:hypothetical protein
MINVADSSLASPRVFEAEAAALSRALEAQAGIGPGG